MLRRGVSNSPLASLLAIALLAGCSGDASRTATPSRPTAPPPAPTASPTPQPTPQPSPSPDAELIGACYGRPVAWAAPYAGRVHPLVIAAPWGKAGVWNWLPDDVNGKWRDGEWASPMIQLVLCPEAREPKAGGSCGSYTIADGVKGELLRLREVLKVRVVIARTGKTLQSTLLLGPKTRCPASTGVFLGVAPPWTFLGENVTKEQIREYAAKVSTQPVE